MDNELDMNCMAHYLAAAENFVHFSCSPAYKQLPYMRADKNKFVSQWLGILRIPTSHSQTSPTVSMRRWHSAHTNLVVRQLGEYLPELSRIAVFRGFCQSGFYHLRKRDKEFPVFIPVTAFDENTETIRTLPMCYEDSPPANEFDSHIQYMVNWLKNYTEKLRFQKQGYIVSGHCVHEMGNNTTALIEFYSSVDESDYVNGIIHAGVERASKLVTGMNAA